MLAIASLENRKYYTWNKDIPNHYSFHKHYSESDFMQDGLLCTLKDGKLQEDFILHFKKSYQDDKMLAADSLPLQAGQTLLNKLLQISLYLCQSLSCRSICSIIATHMCAHEHTHFLCWALDIANRTLKVVFKPILRKKIVL